MALELLSALLCRDWWSAWESEVSTPALTTPGNAARARAADAWEERRLEAGDPLAEACHGATWTWTGSAAPVSSSAPPLSPSPDCDPPVPATGWPPTLTTVARASDLVGSAVAPVLEIPTRLLTWAAVAVALPAGATSAEAATGERPMRRRSCRGENGSSHGSPFWGDAAACREAGEAPQRR